MSGSSKSYDIAKKMVNIYLQMDKNGMTPEQKFIIEDLKACYDDERRNGKVDYFFKRINNIYQTFMLDKIIIDKKPDIIMPRPVFDIFKYDDDSLITFLKILIEKSMENNNRRNKYNLYKKIDVDKDSSEVIDIANKISGKKYELFEFVKNNYDIVNLEELWSKLCSSVLSDYSNEISYYDKKCKQENIDNKNERLKFFAKTYVNIWTDYLKNIIRDFKNGDSDLHIKLDGNNPLFPIIRYKIIWNLWVRIVNKIFQQICIHYYKEEESINGLIDELDLLIQETTNDKKAVQYEKNIADEYYKYYYMLEINSVLNMEIIGLNFINKKDFVFLKKEDLFVDERNIIKEEFSNIDKIKTTELNKLFNSGQKCTKNETFRKNMYYCKKFIPIYNKVAHRRIKEDDIRNLRAVYRALFINKITYERLSTYGMSSKIIELFNEKNVIPEKYYYILSNAISNAILLENIYGYNTMKFKCKFLQAFYKLALLIFYRDCPGMGSSHEELIRALNKIEYNFDKILEELVKIVNNISHEEEA